MTTRFAPSPTGYLHIGHVAHALFVWGLARQIGARILLRIEDHDRHRCRPMYEAAIFEDLDWLGFVPDDGPAGPGDTPSAYRQSDVPARYETAIERLGRVAHVYACRCSRQHLAAAAPARAGAALRYPGTCRDAGLAVGPGLGLRVEMTTGTERFDDLRLGPQQQDPATQCGDVLVRDRNGFWTYQLAVTADDLAHGIDLVVRGEDLLESTGRQLALARLLGRTTPPQYYHHPLVCDRGGAKLSKRRGDTSVRDLRADGWMPRRVLGTAAAAAGLTAHPVDLNVADASDLVALVPRHGGLSRR